MRWWLRFKAWRMRVHLAYVLDHLATKRNDLAHAQQDVEYVEVRLTRLLREYQRVCSALATTTPAEHILKEIL